MPYLHNLVYNKKLTHNLGYCSSCIDLTFTSHSSLFVQSRVYPSLYSNCHHQLSYSKFNLKTFYSTSYKGEIWHYQKANTDQIRRAIEQYYQHRSFKNLDANEMVFLLNPKVATVVISKNISSKERLELWLFATFKKYQRSHFS